MFYWSSNHSDVISKELQLLNDTRRQKQASDSTLRNTQQSKSRPNDRQLNELGKQQTHSRLRDKSRLSSFPSSLWMTWMVSPQQECLGNNLKQSHGCRLQFSFCCFIYGE